MTAAAVSTYGLEVTAERVARGPLAGAYHVTGIQWRRGTAEIVAEYPGHTFLYFTKREAVARYREGIRTGRIVAERGFWG